MDIVLSKTISLPVELKKKLNIKRNLPNFGKNRNNFYYGYNLFIYVCTNFTEAEAVDRKYGDAVKIVSFYPNGEKDKPEFDSRMDYLTIMCTTLENLAAYLEPTSIIHKKYSVLGNGLRKFKWHMYYKGWSYVRHADKVDDFRFEEIPKDRWLYKLGCQMQATLKRPCDVVSVQHLGKTTLHLTLPDLVCKTDLLANVKEFKHLSIIKPSGRFAYGGKDITVCNDEEEFKIGCQKVDGNNAIICDYIENPLLFHDRKFHIRSYLFISSWNKFAKGPLSLVLTAALPYQKGDWLNPAIHDTHNKSTDDVYFLEDLDVTVEELEKIKNDVNNILDKIAGTLDNKIVSYSESIKSWNVLGIDIMIDIDFRAWLLEVNEAPGFQLIHYGEKAKYFDETMLSWEYECIKDQL